MAPDPAIPVALTVAGSDPSGGAGIQADLKMFTVLGVYGGAAITSLTVQNTLGVHASYPVAPQVVREQIEAVLADLPVSHVKIGMVGTAENLAAIGQALRAFHGEVIYDPVMIASSGTELLDDPAAAIVDSELAKRITVITPNRFELQALLATEIGSASEAVRAAADLFGVFPSLRAVVLKGGHIEEESDEVCDYLLLAPEGKAEPTVCSAGHPRNTTTRNTHGTGCTFASAFTAFHLKKGSYRHAFTASSDLIHSLLSKSEQSRTGSGRGGLIHHLASGFSG